MIDPERALRLDGRVVLVTGGTRGIGRAIAEACAAAGAGIAVVARKPDELEETAKAITAIGAPVVAVRGSVGDPETAALFLLSDAASWITGEVLVIDGGAGVSPRA